LTWWLVTT